MKELKKIAVVGRPLEVEDCIYCWISPVQSFSLRRHAELVTIFNNSEALVREQPPLVGEVSANLIKVVSRGQRGEFPLPPVIISVSRPNMTIFSSNLKPPPTWRAWFPYLVPQGIDHLYPQALGLLQYSPA
jgi:hypothetical protein